MAYRKVTTLQPVNIKLPILKSRKSINHCLIITDSNGDVFKFDKYGSYVKNQITKNRSKL